MLSVGDLRNRLMALADESASGNPAIFELFSHRFAHTEAPSNLHARLRAMINGDDLVGPVPTPMRRIIRTHLRLFAESAPKQFDLRGASIGNLILAGGHRLNEGDMDSVIYLFSKLVAVRGTVLPIVDADLHLAARLDNGETIVGQHKFTCKESPPLHRPIQDMWLCRDLNDGIPTETHLHEKVVTLIDSADLIVFPMGSFWSSLMANLLPRGVGRAIANAKCPKVYVPSTGIDPELISTSVTDCIQFLIRALRRDAGEDVPMEDLLNAVILDSDSSNYPMLDIEKIRAQGTAVAQIPMVTGTQRLCPERLALVLLSLA